MSDNEVILYDIANRLNVCWNTNVWKSRMLLNYKGIPYRTEWLEYPDIAPTLSSLGVAAHPSGSLLTHTLPTVRLADGSYVMESRSIADAIDAAYPPTSSPSPSPLLHLNDSEYLPRVTEATGGLTPALKSTVMARVPRELLNPRSAAYWRETRAAFLGMSVDELERTADKEAEWAAAQKHLDALAAMLKEKPEGPFFRGKESSYADIVFAAWLKGASVYNPDVFQRIVDSDKTFQELFDAAKPWMQRDDH